MEINQAVRAFASFLNASWDIVVPLLSERKYSSDESSIGDWLQVNWEILVEKKILQQNEYLEVFGEGADFYGMSSRMTDIEAMPTHSLKVLSKDGAVDFLNNEIIDKTEFEFDRLVGFQNGFYVNSPPFNYTLLIDYSGKERVLLLDKISFELKQI